MPAMPDKLTSSTVSPADSDGEIVSPKKCGHDTAPSSKAPWLRFVSKIVVTYWLTNSISSSHWRAPQVSAPIEAPLALADDVHPSAAPATAT